MSLAMWKKWYLVVMAIFFTIYLTILLADIRPFAQYSNLLGLVGIDLGLCAFLIGIRAHSRKTRTPWSFFALTALCSLIAQSLWIYRDHILGIAAHTLAIPDIFKVSYTLFCIAGIVTFLRREKVSLASFSADLVISLIAAGGFIYIFLIAPAIEGATELSSSLFLQVCYPVFDFGILFGCMVIFFNTGKTGFSRTSLPLMIFGFLIMFAADQLNLLNELHNFGILSYIEPLWALAFCTVGLSCIASAEEEAIEGRIKRIPSPAREKAIEIIRILVPYLITFSALAFLLIQYHLYNFVFCWVTLLVVILSIRQFFVLMNNKRLNRELQKINMQIMHEAQMDFLTKLANRRHIDDVLTDLTHDSQKNHLGLIFIDVDNFKTINDAHGHDVGDLALKGVADAIRSSLRETDIAGRFGGDEFIAVLPGADINVVEDVGETIREHVKTNAALAERSITLSMGAASMLPNGDINVLLKTADNALYVAKNSGRNRLAIVKEPVKDLVPDTPASCV